MFPSTSQLPEHHHPNSPPASGNIVMTQTNPLGHNYECGCLTPINLKASDTHVIRKTIIPLKTYHLSLFAGLIRENHKMLGQEGHLTLQYLTQRI